MNPLGIGKNENVTLSASSGDTNESYLNNMNSWKGNGNGKILFMKYLKILLVSGRLGHMLTLKMGFFLVSFCERKLFFCEFGLIKL